MNAKIKAQWNYPTTVWVGAGRIQELAGACRALGMERPLLVTDEGLASHAMVGSAMELLRAELPGAGMFSRVKSNPTDGNVNDGVEVLRSGGHDGVVAMGGGSALDAGKAIAFMKGQTRPIWDFEDIGDWWTRADLGGIAPVVAVPTTAGTGSEVGRASVITKESAHEKKIIFHPRMLPGRVILDPELTVGLPSGLTAATGIDAFSHCFEAFFAPGFHPLADGIALQGMAMVAEYLPRAVRDGGDLEARLQMLAAAAMGATAFQKGLGGVHGLAHSVGAVYDAPHGLTIGILMPYVYAFNAPEVGERTRVLLRTLGLGDGGAAELTEWLVEFRKQIGIPHTLEVLKVSLDEAGRVGDLALRDPSTGGNPRAITAADYEGIYRRALAGELG
ncbi:MAG: hypothetical protein RI897_2834 [Verrucomicrobiota bacterium]|jgi:alcohol dehydrogenase class IV